MRLFVALDLSSEARTRLSMLAGAGLPGARWVPPENYHLTLRFIGDTPAYRCEEVDLALAAIRSRRFSMELSEVGVFAKSGRAKAVWVGVARNPALEHLAGKIETALQRAGLEPERRRFTPHVTLARCNNVAEDRLASFVQMHNLFRAGPLEVSAFTLFSSLLGKDQAVYTPEVEYELI